MDNIVHPETGEKINIFSQNGLDILNKYLTNYKYGGSLEENITNLQNDFNNIIKYFISQQGGMFTTPITSPRFSTPRTPTTSPRFLTPRTPTTPTTSPIFSTPPRTPLGMSSPLVQSFLFTKSPPLLPDDSGKLKNDFINDFIKYLNETGEEVNIINNDRGITVMIEYKTFYETLIYKFYTDEEYEEAKYLYDRLSVIGEMSDRYVPVYFTPTDEEKKVMNDDFYNTIKMGRMEKYGQSISQWEDSLIPPQRIRLYNLAKGFVEETLNILHRNNLYHGDILKEGGIHPGNVVAEFLDDGWKFKLIDFGYKYNKDVKTDEERIGVERSLLSTPPDPKRKRQNAIQMGRKIRRMEIDADDFVTRKLPFW